MPVCTNAVRDEHPPDRHAPPQRLNARRRPVWMHPLRADRFERVRARSAAWPGQSSSARNHACARPYPSPRVTPSSCVMCAPVIRPSVSSTQAQILSKRPSALLRRELLNITSLITQVACQPHSHAGRRAKVIRPLRRLGGRRAIRRASNRLAHVGTPLPRVELNYACQIIRVEDRGAAGVEGCAVKTRSLGGMDGCHGHDEDRRATGGEEDGAIGKAGCSLGGAGHRRALTRHRGVAQTPRSSARVSPTSRRATRASI